MEAVSGSVRGGVMLSKGEMAENGYATDGNNNGEGGDEIGTGGMGEGVKDSGAEYFKSCRTIWVLQAVGEERTRVELGVEVEWVNALFAGVTEGVVQEVADGMVWAFERRARELLR